MNEWSAWIRAHPTALWWLTAASVIMFVVSLVIVPAVVVGIPHNYFAHERRPTSPWAQQHWALRGIVLVLKNMAGFFLIVAGIVMLVLPGQGILTMLAGIMLSNFPWKFQLERWLVTRGPALRTINWLRRRVNRRPLVVHD